MARFTVTDGRPDCGTPAPARFGRFVLGIVVALFTHSPPGLAAADSSLIVELEGGDRVSLVGAVRRWDQDGNPLRKVDPKAKIESPTLDAVAKRESPHRWIMTGIPAGRYDIVVLTDQQVRIEGFDFPPVLEFDPFLAVVNQPADADAQLIRDEIAKAPHYENKVCPLWLAGDGKQIRAFVQLLRDEATSYDAEYGQPVATIRHEVWQSTNRYGTWAKEKRTRVFDRVLMAKSELRRWTWIWDPSLGGVDVGNDPATVRIRFLGK